MKEFIQFLVRGFKHAASKIFDFAIRMGTRVYKELANIKERVESVTLQSAASFVGKSVGKAVVGGATSVLLDKLPNKYDRFATAVKQHISVPYKDIITKDKNSGKATVNVAGALRSFFNDLLSKAVGKREAPVLQIHV
jgi:hypothetical protein